MKIVMTQAVTSEGMEMLDGIADIYVADNPDPNNYLDEMKDADALIVRIAKCDGSAISNSPNLKVIGRTGVGYDTVDVETATKHGIPVVITPGTNNRSVAEHAVALIFSLAKNLFEGQTEMTAGNWEVRGLKKAFELEGKTVGIIGLGAIGRETAKICKGIGMNVAGYDPFLKQEDIEKMGMKYFEDYRKLLEACDVVSVHVPLTKETENMISKLELATMKKTALLINTSRGGIVNERDLMEALKNGTIAGAGFDAFCNEPLEADDPLLNCPNLVVSPHSAAQTREAVIKMAKLCVKGCLAVANGKKWPYVADPSVYSHPKWEGTEWEEA